MKVEVSRLEFVSTIKKGYRELIEYADEDVNLKKLVNVLMYNEILTHEVLTNGRCPEDDSAMMTIANNIFIDMLLDNKRFNLSEGIVESLNIMYASENKYNDYIKSMYSEDTSNKSIIRALNFTRKRIIIIENILKFNLSKL